MAENNMSDISDISDISDVSNMTNASNIYVVVGCQWGDEGKGKIVDLLAQNADAVVRFQGGHNAGHTLVIKDEIIKLKLIPSGIMHPNTKVIIGHGVVLSLSALLEEWDMLKKIGISVENQLSISNMCPLILPSHQQIDLAREQALNKQKIGTTGRGIGPAYEDKISRRAIKVNDLFYPDQLSSKLESLLDYHNFILTNYYKTTPVSIEQVKQELLTQFERVKNNITDTTALIHKLNNQNKNIMFEGAQGALLDIDHGTYPFVTSSNTTVGAITSGAGLGPKDIDQIIGITKAYTTRVGSGPFVTEIPGEIQEHLAQKGKEVGTVTGRRRRCGWLDLIALRRVVKINSITQLCITKIDVLDELAEIPVCTGYTYKNKPLASFPQDLNILEQCKPIYKILPGWNSCTAGITEFNKLPKHAQKYLEFIKQQLQIEINIVSTGPERDETMFLKPELLW